MFFDSTVTHRRADEGRDSAKLEIGYARTAAARVLWDARDQLAKRGVAYKREAAATKKLVDEALR